MQFDHRNHTKPCTSHTYIRIDCKSLFVHVQMCVRIILIFPAELKKVEIAAVQELLACLTPSYI